jgi:hypothetical protein
MEYTEGLCGDGVVILCDGNRVSISDVLKTLNKYVEAKREADCLATVLYKKYYTEESPDFELLDTAAGVITQINNMVSGLKKE